MMKTKKMKMNQILRTMAGVVVSGSLALGYYVDAGWFYLTAFAGLNLLQSGFTDWCPAMWLLRKCGVREG